MEGEQVFPALLYPLHWTAQAHSQVRHSNLFGVQAPLFPEAAAHVWGYHTHTALRSVQHRGQVVPDRMGVLRRVPHGQDIVLGLVVGHYSTCLQRCWSQALYPVALPDDVLGLRQGCLNVAISIERAQGNICAQCLVHDGGVCLHRRQRVDDGR
jgi:hypothetical protein